MSIDDHLIEFQGKPVRDFSKETGLQDPEEIVYRFRVGWDDDTSLLVQNLREALSSKGAPKVEALVIGCWSTEGDDPSTVRDFLVKSHKKLPELRALMFGDIVEEEQEISWIVQCDLGPLLRAYPKLEYLRVRGGSSLRFRGASSTSLKTLIVESGGLHKEVIRDILQADLPNLEHLELWLGSEDYGFNGSVFDLRALVDGKVFPKLKYLGLRDSEIADEIAEALQLSQTVDASESIDVRGKTVLLTGKLNNIKRKEAQTQLEAMGAKVAKSVTKKLDYLIAGEKAGSKLDKAKSLGVATLTEAQLLEILGVSAEKEVSDASSNVLERLEVLDLSLGTLSDKGAKALLGNPLLAKLKRLDLHHHYMSDASVKSLVQAFDIDIDVSDQQQDDDGWRYIAVAE